MKTFTSSLFFIALLSFICFPTNAKAQTEKFLLDECYNYHHTGNFAQMDLMTGMISSDFVLKGGGLVSDSPYFNDLDNHTLTFSSPIANDTWQLHYEVIEKCNEVLYCIDNNEQNKAYFAEAKFLRAYSYFHLARWFGGVPLELHDCPAGIPGRSSREAVFNQIETDLLSAIPDLRAKSELGWNEKHKATKGAACSVLAMVYVWQERWVDAKDVLEQIIESREYSLMENFNNLWLEINEHNTESIFEYEYYSNRNYDWGNFDWDNPESNLAIQLLGPSNLSNDPDFNTGWGFGQVTQELVDFYDSRNDDIRKNATILDIQERIDNGANTSFESYQYTGYKNKKYTTRKVNTTTEGWAVRELNYGQNNIKIRYAEILLLYAEALARTGDLAEAIKPLNIIRQRAGMPDISSSSSSNELLEVIFDERTAELACEGKRFFDLVRWGKAAEVMADKGFESGKNELWPIPYAAFDKYPQMTQNPGYEENPEFNPYNTERISNPYPPEPALPWKKAEQEPLNPEVMEIYEYNLCLNDSFLTHKTDYLYNSGELMEEYILSAYDVRTETFKEYYKETYKYDEENRLILKSHFIESGEEWDTAFVNSFIYLPDDMVVDSAINYNYIGTNEPQSGNVYKRSWDEENAQYAEERVRYVLNENNQLVISEATTFKDRRYLIQYNENNQIEEITIEVENDPNQWDLLSKTVNTFTNGNKTRIEEYYYQSYEETLIKTYQSFNTFDKQGRLVTSKFEYTGGQNVEVLEELRNNYESEVFDLVKWIFVPHDLMADELVGERKKQLFKLKNSTSVFDTIEDSLKSRIVIAPNPSDGNIILVSEKGIPGFVKVYDLKGKMMLEQTIRGNKLNLTSLSNGMYLLNFGKDIETVKVFIDR